MQQIKQEGWQSKYIFPTHGDRLLVSFGMMMPILFVMGMNWKLGCVFLATFLIYATSYYTWHYRCRRGVVNQRLARICTRVALGCVVGWLLTMAATIWSVVQSIF